MANEQEKAAELLGKIRKGEALNDEDTSLLTLVFKVFSENVYNARFRIDGGNAFAVREEDRILVREVIRHYRERFIKEGEKKGDAYGPVISMIKKLSIEYQEAQDLSYEEVELLGRAEKPSAEEPETGNPAV